MMELITHVVKEVPTIAIWIFLIFYGFKVIVAGSIYGVVRHATTKITEVFKMKHENKAAEIEKSIVRYIYQDLNIPYTFDPKELILVARALNYSGGKDTIRMHDSHLKALLAFAEMIQHYDLYEGDVRHLISALQRTRESSTNHDRDEIAKKLFEESSVK